MEAGLIALLAGGVGFAAGYFVGTKRPHLPQNLEPHYNTPEREADAERRRMRYIP